MTDYFTAYYFRTSENRITERQRKELTVFNNNYEKYHKYQTEHKIHYWLPPITVLPPQDNSITDLYI